MFSIPVARRLVALVGAVAAVMVFDSAAVLATEQPVCVKTPSHYVVCI